MTDRLHRAFGDWQPAEGPLVTNYYANDHRAGARFEVGAPGALAECICVPPGCGYESFAGFEPDCPKHGTGGCTCDYGTVSPGVVEPPTADPACPVHGEGSR
jgi:hypothetical protein